MAFLDTVIGSRLPTARTLLEAVQRVVRACGQDAPTSVSGDNPNHIERAVAAVNDSVQRVYNACLWDFRGRWAYCQLEDKKMWYRLPSDFAARATDGLVLVDDSGLASSGDNNYGPVRFVEYRRLMNAFPGYPVPPSTQQAEPGTSYTVRTTYAITDHIGVPEYFTIYGDYLGVYPIPATTLEDDYDFVLSVPLLFAYWGLQKDLDENADEIPLPHNLLVPQHNLALAYYKQSMEYADFQADEARGERQLAMEVAKYQQKAGDTQLNLVSEEYGRL